MHQYPHISKQTWVYACWHTITYWLPKMWALLAASCIWTGNESGLKKTRTRANTQATCTQKWEVISPTFLWPFCISVSKTCMNVCKMLYTYHYTAWFKRFHLYSFQEPVTITVLLRQKISWLCSFTKCWSYLEDHIHDHVYIGKKIIQSLNIIRQELVKQI